MTDAERLSALVAVWWEAVDSFTHLLEQVGDDQWSTPTDLPGWDVHAVAAHTAHLEALLAGREHEDVEIGDAPHARGTMGQFTEQGVVARRAESPDDLITEIRESTTARHTQLPRRPAHRRRRPPRRVSSVRSAGRPDCCCATARWTCGCTSRTSAVPSTCRATSTPAPAVHSADYLMESLPYVVGKRAQAPVGSVVRLEVAGHDPVTVAVGEDGRGRVATPDDGEPTVTLAMDRATFVVLAGGRRPAEPGCRTGVAGDDDLGERVLTALGGHPVSEAAWTTDDIGDLSGRTAVVTGPTQGGLGFHTALELARHGARVVARRDARRPSSTPRPRRSPPRCRTPSSTALVVDLSDLASVRAAGEAAAGLGPIDLLVNNAGVMASPVPLAPSTGSSRRWRPTTSGPSC